MNRQPEKKQTNSAGKDICAKTKFKNFKNLHTVRR